MNFRTQAADLLKSEGLRYPGLYRRSTFLTLRLLDWATGEKPQRYKANAALQPAATEGDLTRVLSLPPLEGGKSPTQYLLRFYLTNLETSATLEASEVGRRRVAADCGICTSTGGNAQGEADRSPQARDVDEQSGHVIENRVDGGRNMPDYHRQARSRRLKD